MLGKTLLGVLIVAGTALILVVAQWIGVLLGWWDPLRRPDGVSPDAHFVFAWESAAWFDCKVDLPRDVNTCKVWDGDGRLLASGDFRLAGESRAARKEELHPSAPGPTNPDGTTDVIYLFGPGRKIEGMQLVRVKPPQTAAEP